jgi:hypothetical protein
MPVPSNRPMPARAVATTAVATVALAVLAAPPAVARPVPATNTVAAVGPLAQQTKVVDLRVGAHRRFDRVVIDLVGRVPRFDVRYVRHLSTTGPVGECR